MTVSRRDFLRLRASEHGRMIELSCRMLYMRCSDAAIASPSQEEYEQSVGEPPALLTRRTPDEIVDAIETDLRGVQVLRLIEPEWLDALGTRFTALLDRFRARGGRVERA